MLQPSSPLRISCCTSIVVRVLFLIGLLINFLAPNGGAVRAQASPQIRVNRIEILLPRAIRFHLDLSSDVPIQKISLIYGINAKNCLAGSVRREMDFQAGSNVKLEWDWNFYQSGSVPPGAEVWWQWELRDRNGAVTQTEKRVQRVEDSRYAWKNIRQGSISLWWTTGDEQFAASILRLAVNSLNRLAQEAGIATEDEIRLILYPSAADLQNVVFAVPEWTGGLAFSDYGVVIIGIAPGQMDWARSVVPHELAHLITGEQTFNCVGGRVPTWLNEGISVYAEGEANSADLDRLQRALKNETLPPLNQLAQGFAANAARADLAYIQSGETVRYLIQQHGPEKSRELLSKIQSGSDVDEALMAIYGFDTTGLDNAWRTSQGYAPVATRPPTQAAAKRTPIPTIALWAAASATPSPTLTPPPSATAVMPSQTATSVPAASPPVAASQTPAKAEPSRVLPGWIVALAGACVLAAAGVFLFRRLRR